MERVIQQEILQFVRLVQNRQDDVVWKWEATGVFSVKTAYFNMMNGPRVKTKSGKTWKLITPPRVKLFGWLLLINRILTIANLNRRGWCLVN